MASTSPTTGGSEAAPPIRYVVVVHGIGDQRKNETVIQVINRFAAARLRAGSGEGEPAGEARELLTLGRASGQTGTDRGGRFGSPWIELEGVPRDPAASVEVADALMKYSSSGENLRFVDLWWSDLLERDTDPVVQRADLWAQGVVGRLKRNRRVPRWARRTVEALADTVLLARFVTKLRFKDLHELLFYKFLSDVQLYGEYPRTRGRSVRRFHEVMQRIHAEHQQLHSDREARYTIIAHSLGTVLSMDALLYARVHREIREEAVSLDELDDIPFPGYLDNLDGTADDAFLDTSWIDSVDSWITLGSPIDKFLAIWWFNYRYLLYPGSWLETPSNGRSHRRIVHHNYCDEQDPVGHRLDVAWTTPAFTRLFERGQDVVYNRYRLPGVAHNEYWNDEELFRWVLRTAIDEPASYRRAEAVDAAPEADEPSWFEEGAYKRMLAALYTWIPLLVIGVDFLALSFVLRAEGLHSLVFGSAVIAVVSVLGAQVLELSMLWREIQRHKVEAKQTREIRRTREIRERTADHYLHTSKALRYLSLLLGGAAVGAYLQLWPADAAAHVVRLTLILGLGLLVVMLGYVTHIRLPSPYRISSSFAASGRVPAQTVFIVTAGWVLNALVAAAAAWVVWRLLPVSVSDLAQERAWLEPALFYSAAWFVTAAVVLTYRRARYKFIEVRLEHAGQESVDFREYVEGDEAVTRAAAPAAARARGSA